MKVGTYQVHLTTQNKLIMATLINLTNKDLVFKNNLRLDRHIGPLPQIVYSFKSDKVVAHKDLELVGQIVEPNVIHLPKSKKNTIYIVEQDIQLALLNRWDLAVAILQESFDVAGTGSRIWRVNYLQFLPSRKDFIKQ
jgi:hypothetical protein